MIFDSFENLHRYPAVPFLKEIERFVEGLVGPEIESEAALVPMDKHCLSENLRFPFEAEYEIVGRELFVRTGSYSTGPAEEKQFEAHQFHADLQLMVSGREIMECGLARVPKPVTSYDKRADIQFFEAPPEFSSVLVSAGHFVVFFPGELHKPGCQVDSKPGPVKKLVFKIRMAANPAGSFSKEPMRTALAND